MKIVITELRQETNSLNPIQSDLEFWRRNGWTMPPEQVPSLVGTSTALSGMVAELRESTASPEIVFGPAFYAQSGGTATQEVMEEYLAQLRPVLEAAMPVDGVFLSFHGALQTTGFDDAEAEVARAVREIVGEQCVLAISTDLHGYISARSFEQIDIVCGYHTYPHRDFVETGRRAARWGLRTIMEPAVPPQLAWVPVPMMVSASGYDTEHGAFKAVIESAQALVEAGEILDFSIYQMQPWLDVREPHSTVVTIATDQQLASAAAELLADRLYSSRTEFGVDLRTIDEVIELAENQPELRPVVLVDSADSPNAGATGDSAAVVARLTARGSTLRAASVVVDPAAARRAHELGVGTRAQFEVGGRIDPAAGTVTFDAEVVSLHEGGFRLERPGSSGDTAPRGLAAVLQSGNLRLLVCETLSSPGDLALYRSVGIDPAQCDLVVVKANGSFRAQYSQIAGVICDTDSPGSASARIIDLPFQRLDRRIFPWVDAPFLPQAQPGRRTGRSTTGPDASGLNLPVPTVDLSQR